MCMASHSAMLLKLSQLQCKIKVKKPHRIVGTHELAPAGHKECKGLQTGKKRRDGGNKNNFFPQPVEEDRSWTS